ncbi:hypothetical protein [Paraburkholderia sp. SIMBA_030]|uniref:hypothetical protein n=1 Tax=Paraburkholderia sp. SIMBA_030 TaxID=3085773 RepID=UPI00397DB272
MSKLLDQSLMIGQQGHQQQICWIPGFWIHLKQNSFQLGAYMAPFLEIRQIVMSEPRNKHSRGRVIAQTAQATGPTTFIILDHCYKVRLLFTQEFVMLGDMIQSLLRSRRVLCRFHVATNLNVAQHARPSAASARRCEILHG